MKNQFSLQSLAVSAFAQAEGRLEGELPLAQFERLAQESLGDAAAVTVRFSLQGSQRSDAAGVFEPWLHLAGSTRLRMVCQRCLAEAELEVAFARDFRFVASEALAEVEDEESEEDVLVLSRTFDARELLEDELLLAMPLVPKHDVCPGKLKLQAQDADFADGEGQGAADKPNPFAVLEKLKKGAG